MRLLIDFNSLFLYDVTNISKKPFAWVAEDKRCFFPNHQLGSTGREGNESDLAGNIVPTPVQVRAPVNPAYVRNMFILGMVDYANVEVLNIQPTNRIKGQTRAEIFEQYVEIVKFCREYPNVQYGWLPSNKSIIENAMTTNVGFPGKFGMTGYGYGALLTPLDLPHISARNCDAHEDGVRYILFCRVILGNVEEIDPESQQNNASNDAYDTGVDNLLHPRRYIIWSDMMDSFIFPEYTVTFRMQGDLIDGQDAELGVVVDDVPTEGLLCERNGDIYGNRCPSTLLVPWPQFSANMIRFQDIGILREKVVGVGKEEVS
ncbi:hypothetical protein CDL15_Pgr022648 [Punica granatum]|uniref:PARP catalytic domain-containing protein n=1 Tax=Punica granatum TaxID=22663 RepID=A0A218XSA5_PUNGR|nr:hypothetical protein CDL15_Pgr022648 [Punica granatum]